METRLDAGEEERGNHGHNPCQRDHEGNHQDQGATITRRTSRRGSPNARNFEMWLRSAAPATDKP